MTETDSVTVADLEARWRTLATDERERAQALLLDAVARLRAQAPDAAADLVRSVACAMVIRAMAAGASAPLGATQSQWSADSYSASVSFANPSGDLYLTQQEQRLLGIGTGRIGFVQLGG